MGKVIYPEPMTKTEIEMSVKVWDEDEMQENIEHKAQECY